MDADYNIVIKESCPYEYYVSLTQSYFEYLDVIIEEKYLWDNILKEKIKIAEVRTNDGELAAFSVFILHGKTIESRLIAVDPKYRGIGLVRFIRKNTGSYCERSKGWIHDWNQKSWKSHISLGYKKSGNYQAVYGN